MTDDLRVADLTKLCDLRLQNAIDASNYIFRGRITTRVLDIYERFRKMTVEVGAQKEGKQSFEEVWMKEQGIGGCSLVGDVMRYLKCIRRYLDETIMILTGENLCDELTGDCRTVADYARVRGSVINSYLDKVECRIVDILNAVEDERFLNEGTDEDLLSD